MSRDMKDLYDAVVDYEAGRIVDDVKSRPPGAWYLAFDTLINEVANNHEWVTDIDKSILTLVYSDHPSAGIVDGTWPVRSQDLGHDPKHPFPFSQFAGDAFEKDVQQKCLELFDADGININDPQYDAEDSTDVTEGQVREAFLASVYADRGHESYQFDFEHSAWWVTELGTGRQWGVVEATGGNSVGGLDFEQVSAGDAD